MPTRCKVFIGSSSEGSKVADAVRLLLINELGESAKVELWTRKFELSATYIESLEKVLAEADFAVMVLTPDDVTTSRNKEKLAPRDNVIFELGLFMGGLGRERCYLVHEDNPEGKANLKLPSDLLGVKAATFKRQDDEDLETVLNAKCALIARQMSMLPLRHKLNPDEAAARASTLSFCERLEGAWWEHVSAGEKCWLSFFKIELDNLHNSVQLNDGRHFEPDGSLTARWKSVTTRFFREENKVVYLWQGWYPSSTDASPQDRFHGYGEFEFEIPAKASEPIARGQGKFWNVDETHPERTLIKVVQLRRVPDKSISTMTSGKQKEIRDLVTRTFRDWE
ncbi:MAG: nucleotide-binding protein [Sulfuricella sp.]